MKNIIVIIVLITFFFGGCKDRYDPPVESIPQPLLVVEANLNPSGPTNVRLTRTSKLDRTNSIVNENNAIVTIEGKDNSVQNLTGAGNGNYQIQTPTLIIGNEYRLRIKTTGGDEFLSDYVKAKQTPLIDSVSWERTNKGVQVYVNTKDPSNTTKYYRWDYVETWEIHSAFPSDKIYVNGRVRDRVFPVEDVSTCWKTSLSTGILLANSLRLQTDVISKAPIVFIPESNEKLVVRYSIIVKQYSLDADAYKYYEILKKNTEEIGTFFGPLPSELKGNIHCVNKPNEKVIGFVTASETNEKRIFISGIDVVPWPFFMYCMIDSIPNHPDSIRMAIEKGFLISQFFGPLPPNKYTIATPDCIDCTTRGGINVKPSFW